MENSSRIKLVVLYQKDFLLCQYKDGYVHPLFCSTVIFDLLASNCKIPLILVLLELC